MNLSRSFTPRLLAGVSTLTLLAGIVLLASRPAHTAGGPVAVSVANTPLATIPTDVAAPSQPFQARTYYLIPNGSSYGSVDTAGGANPITIPAGKRLIIQSVGLNEDAANGQTLHAFIQTVINGDYEFYSLPSVPDDGTSEPGATQVMQLSTDAGNLLFAVSRKGTSGRNTVFLTVYGYLVKA